MTTKSPTASVKLREVIGDDQFTQRREVFDKYDTVFLPASPVAMAYKEVQPIVTSNHGKTTTNFKRNAPTYSSMRESRTEERNMEFRTRKYSDNYTSELNQSDDVDYRRSMTDRTRRLSKMRRDFLNSNLHEPTDSPFARSGVRASMPVSSAPPIRYKIESPNLFKFPFAEPFATPPSVRKVTIDLGPVQMNGDKENEEVDAKYRHQSLPNNNNTSPKVDHQKIFEDLLKRYSPDRKPIDWKLPPTRPRVVGSVPKSTSSMADGVDTENKKALYDELTRSTDEDEVFDKDASDEKVVSTENKEEARTANHEKSLTSDSKQNGPDTINAKGANKNDSKSSLTELEEKNDEVPELSTLQRQSRDTSKRPSLDKYTDITLPDLIEKITEESDDLESHAKEAKKGKRKRSFLDKLLGRNKKEK